MKSAVLGAALLSLAAVFVLTGILKLEDAAAVGERVWPILLFVVAITLVTELAAEAGLFREIAQSAAGWGRGRTWILWLLVVAFAIVSTVFLSLDTTAVLVTPVVVVLAKHVGLPPIPFALTTVWLANTASLFLPVSNLTNLLAQHALGGISPLAFAVLMWAPSIAAIVAPLAVLLIVYRREIFTRYVAGPTAAVSDRVLLIASGVVVGAMLPALVSGVPVWIPAAIGTFILIGFFGVRRREVLRFALVPWQLVVLAGGLFLVVESAHSLGLEQWLAQRVGSGDDPLSLAALAGTAAAGANVVNNLPAYLAFESIAASPVRIAAVLIGVNAGCLITPWASLATLLWHTRMKAMGVEISWLRYGALGLIVAPLSVGLAVLALVTVNGGW